MILPLPLTHARAESKRDLNSPGDAGRRVGSRVRKAAAQQHWAPWGESRLLTGQMARKQGQPGATAFTDTLLTTLRLCWKGGSKRESLDQGSANTDVLFNINPANINGLMQGKPGFLKCFQVFPFVTGGRRLCRDAIIIQNKALKAKETQNYH